MYDSTFEGINLVLYCRGTDSVAEARVLRLEHLGGAGTESFESIQKFTQSSNSSSAIAHPSICHFDLSDAY